MMRMEVRYLEGLVGPRAARRDLTLSHTPAAATPQSDSSLQGEVSWGFLGGTNKCPGRRDQAELEGK